MGNTKSIIVYLTKHHVLTLTFFKEGFLNSHFKAILYFNSHFLKVLRLLCILLPRDHYNQTR